MKKIKEYIKFTFEYFKENIAGRHLWINITLFLMMVGASFVVMRNLPEAEAKEFLMQINELFEGKNVENSDGSLSFWGIFINNLRAGVIISITGFVPFLFLPAVYVAMNAEVIGGFMGIVDVLTTENVFLLFVKNVLPHGVFEIPALIIEGAVGTKLCAFMCRKIFRKAKEESFKYHLKGMLGILIFIIIPLLIVAAFIEGVLLEIIYGY